LDGHPELHVHAYDLHIGHPTKHDWPTLDSTASAETWAAQLRQPRLQRLFETGYVAPGPGEPERSQALPFLLVPSFLERLFLLLVAERRPQTPRDIFDRYFSAYFNAWLDYQGLEAEPKRWVAGFGPRLAWDPSRTAFLSDYPDGRIISVLRDPRSWYASASAFSSKYDDLHEGTELWLRGARELEEAKAAHPEQTLLLTYEALVSDPERVMRRVATWLGIAWDRVLLRPTFNRRPVAPNSSHGLLPTEVRQDSLERWRDLLSDEQAWLIADRALDVYERVRAIADET